MALTAFRGKTLLVVEDGSFLREDVRAVLLEAGALLIGPTAMAEDLIFHLSGHIDGAIVDVEIPGDAALYVNDVLEARGIPFLFATNRIAIPDAANYSGFAFVANAIELNKIAVALFGNSSAETLH